MLSLWSALNPGVWVSKGDSEDGSFTMPPEIPVDETTRVYYSIRLRYNEESLAYLAFSYSTNTILG